MSGHSKWSKVKHQKESTDAVKGKIFTKLSNSIIVAVKQGGGNSDPNLNFKLRLAIDNARSHNMPKDNIERAIERGKGSSAEDSLSEVMYEAYASNGIGLIILAATNKKQRTVANIKNILEKEGGVLAASGSVSHLFDYFGNIKILKGDKSFDEILEIALNSGAEDIKDHENVIDIFTKPNFLHKVRETAINNGLQVLSSELLYYPKISVPLIDKETALKITKLVSRIEDNEDVFKVYSNFMIPDNLLVEYTEKTQA
ncbi:YebC/PmpR family DNA-binding transcriptional regulator [Candidatus Gottesmanbacteria bacterium CG11_big_fil_rev_8_21_14_0_20_37_11]|uniref:Probable transcriptional regulatory protein COY59_06415 n=3 Tax=Candidatus Gottesmaniibacteriota TaxID=1752720 RepID=A0A2M7RPE3_9BACT|nr:MAG: hypothetical protein AUJ73_05090 [Candidatus Gottesmanbacteria bacterium CG1_02_37_22]PIP33248.1 MAG: YebC/PmpR family DNA-binding transcriptional regulator [Candidatus Gottesmanbacteria bacterium CG23_combo_of_CG06-09_8_20_14_all_37_19]PIR08106.1 MAG: YebC/PmpR family DNA-binding transcriptional regulator [Candidatus Gottesmanbacteria bacterium CG11_big_fil_rev_8_21_14_0_20_37_11]PIZ02142.1 MAG: YebC/PmpR family DNA-binding transcriptional regulator [Candidatus Gottesmanbacteria bacteri